MHRIPNWQSRLSEYLVSSARTRFKYGYLDCGLFVADSIQAMTNVDVGDPLRGKYRTRTEAFAAIKELCGHPTMEAVAAYLADRHSIPEVRVLCAQRGDAVVLRKGRRSSLGIVAMHGTEILTPYKDGILRLPLSHAIKAYHV